MRRITARTAAAHSFPVDDSAISLGGLVTEPRQYCLIFAGTMSLTSVVAIFLRKIFPLFQCLVSRIGRLFSFRRKTQNIGELPFTVPRTERADFGGSLPAQTGSWDDGWQNTASFHEETVSSKIEEYRRKRAEELRRSEQSASGEPDFFDDMQPTIKAEKTVTEPIKCL
uniref:BAT2_N domain-containing protein n=1 Tax=Steinernema glaseri TaxID=37863 RepID=A0A1I7ZDR2_9BILA